MLTRRIIIVLCAATACWCLFFLWNNILVLDDFHPNGAATTDTTVDLAEAPTENSQTPSDSNKPPAKKGYYIHINLDETMMYVYKNGELLKTYPVSGGKASTPSPLGTWRIISKDTWGEGFGGAWLGFNVPYGKFGIHGTVEPWFVGKSNQSKGCIRMKNNDVKELYTIVPHGTTVTIAHDNRIFRAMQSGDIGSDVVEIQKALKKLGYYTGSIDGRFGTGLKLCVQKFQETNNLKVSGIVSRQTYNLILEKQKAFEEQQQPPQ